MQVKQFETACRGLWRGRSVAQIVILDNFIRRRIAVYRDELYYTLYDIIVFDNGAPVEDNLGVHEDDLLDTLETYFSGELTGVGLA